MQKWLDDNYILMHSSQLLLWDVILSYLRYLNKIGDECKNTSHRSIGKKPVHVGFSILSKEIHCRHKFLKFKVGDRFTIINCKNIFSEDYTENWSNEILDIDFMLKTNSWANKIEDLNGETLTGKFDEKIIVAEQIINGLFIIQIKTSILEIKSK